MENKRLLEHFRQAKAWIEESCYRDTLERFRGLRSEDISRDDFFAKYVYVVLASGFNVCVAQQVELKLEQALKGYDVDAIARSPDRVYRDALRVFGYEGKVNAIVNTAKLLANSDWEEVKAKLTGPSHLRFMEKLGFIGPVTRYHLARNIGLLDYAKPDRWMVRLAGESGYGGDADGVFAMVAAIQKATGERPGIIDYILWEYERQSRPPPS